MRFLIFKCQLHPVGRSRHFGNPHLVHLPHKAPANLQLHGGEDAHHRSGRCLGVWLAIHINLRVLAVVGVNRVGPFKLGDHRLAVLNSTVGGDRHMRRRTKQSHVHRVRLPPIHDAHTQLVRLEPHLRSVRTRGKGIAADFLPTIDSFATDKLPPQPDHSKGGDGIDIQRGQPAGVIAQRMVHVPHAEIAILSIENRWATRLAGRLGFAPVHLDFLARIPLDQRHLHPDGGRPNLGVPLVDLISQRSPRTRTKPQILAVRLGFREREPILVQPHEHRKILLHRRRRKVRSIRIGEQPQSTHMTPIRIGRNGLHAL